MKELSMVLSRKGEKDGSGSSWIGVEFESVWPPIDGIQLMRSRGLFAKKTEFERLARYEFGGDWVETQWCQGRGVRLPAKTQRERA